MIFPDTPLYDYFAVIGYNPELGLKQEKFSEFGDKTTISLPKSPLETSYEAKIIAHYPKERDGKPFATEICSLAMPCGVWLYTAQNVPRDPSFHSFVVVREDGTRLYGCSLVFYEELKSLELRQQIFDAQLTYLRDFASNSTSIPQSFIGGTNESTLPNASLRKFTTHSLPRKLSSTRRNSSNPNNANDEHFSYYKSAKTPLFISKSMVLLSPIPVIYSSENLLRNIWMVINDKFSEEPIVFEDLLYWTLHQVPLPPPGTSMNVSHCHFQLLVKKPNPNDFDFFDYPIVNLFKHFSSLDIFFKVLTSFMLEKQILIISKNAKTLMLVAETLSTLIYPFVWNLAYCPILPHSQMKFLEAPVPWLMGLCLESDTFKEELPQSNICFLDIDSQRLEAPEDLPSFPRVQKISAQILALQKEFSERPAPEGIHGFYQRGLQFNQEIRSIFVNHFATIFSSYENYLLNISTENHLDKSSSMKNRQRNAKIMRESTANFDKISFLVDQPESILPFLSAFLETQMFTSFIDSKILSLQNNPTMGQTENRAICIFDQRIANLQKLNSQNDDQISFVEESVGNNPPEYRINPPPISTMDFRPKYGGCLPNIDHLFLVNKLHNKNKYSSTIMEKNEELLEEEKKIQQNQPKQQLIMGGKENLLLNKAPNEQPQQQCSNDKKSSQPPMLAHQNWKFVEQLLNETKAKTKRILVAKMGKEAIHLGHGQLSNFGVSGVEENTLVAVFCDLLERIWSHGLKRKQGKSALWAYITAFHEFEEKNNRISSRRSSSIDVDNSSTTNGESFVKEGNTTDESPMLVELISSIRRIAGTMEMPRSRDNSPHQQHFHSNSNNTTTTNLASNWSQSLLRAANVICDKIATTNLTGEDQQMKEMKQVGAQNVGNKAANLPPRPPSASKATSENEWKLFTPQIRKKMKKEEEEKTVEAYRKFIYNGPLKAVNNNQQFEGKAERKSRESRRLPKRLPRSASSQPSNGFEGNKNLASHVSEDSLSRMALSTTITSITDKPPTTPKRSTHDLSIGPYHQQRNRSLSRSNSPSRLYERLTRGVLGGNEPRTLKPLPNTMTYDLKNIIRMTEIKTDIGFARAFVRLALERKLLYLYLKKLLSNTQLLQKMYKRYSFLRSDDEREQFLFHLLSLNAVDFSCFTNTFLTIKMRYQVLLVGSLDKFSESLVYIVLTGSLGCTSPIFLPANSTQFTFHFKNLGLLSTLRVGHSTKDRYNQKLTKWYLDYVLVRNCVTAQTFYFRCGRWFGRGIDDGALERLLVAEAIVSRPVDETQSDCEQQTINPLDQRRPESPSSVAAIFLSPRKTNKFDVAANSTYSSQQNQSRMMRRLRSPSTDRRKMSNDYELPLAGQSMEGIAALDQLQTLEHRAGMAVNALMKHFLANTERDQQNAIAKLSTLLCAEDGLVPCIYEIFSNGLVHRLFQRTYPWDYVEKVFAWFNQFFRNGDSRKLTREQRSLIIYAYKMVERIGAHNVVGKEGKFHLFVLLSIRDHIFSGLIPLMAWTSITSQIYEPNAFLRQSSKLSYLAKLLGSLNEFQFIYEKSLTHGIAF